MKIGTAMRWMGWLVFLLSALVVRHHAARAQEDPTFPYYVEMVADINPGGSSSPSWFVEVNGDLYFQAQTDDKGVELWRYSPLTGKATLVADIYKGKGSSKPEWLTVYGGSIYFAATDASVGRQLWRYNTATGESERLATQEYFDLGLSLGVDPQWLRFVGPVLYYSAKRGNTNGRELYAYDVRDGRSWLVADINPGGGDSTPKYLAARGSMLYFVADDGSHGVELWRSDGSAAGTVMIKDILAGPRGSNPSSFNLLGEMLVFSADDGVHGRELWRSYGSGGATSMISDIYPGKEDSNPGWSNRLGNSMVFFPASTEENGNELWRYDPQQGAYLLADINPGKEDSDPAAIGDVGWTMFFSANDGETGVELWKTEPPYSYAVQVADINPGKQDSTPKVLERMGTTLFFTATDPDHGEEVWVTEFPYTQAFLLKDIRPGKAGSIPTHDVGDYTGTLSSAHRIGWTIYFTANDGRNGVELWQISLGALPQTGFPPDVRTSLPSQPEGLTYQNMGDMQLEIPGGDGPLVIVGAPKVGNTWPLDWLAPGQVAWLEGTAFPGLAGNTVISGHVFDANGAPGPFVNLEQLSWGDEIVIYAWGQRYIYQVREVYPWVDPNDKTLLAHRERDWITLITCKGYDQVRGVYRWRTAVQAVLVEVRE